MKTDTNTLAAQLRELNRWRRGDETLEQPDPTDLGKMIDDAADRLEKLERELAGERKHFDAAFEALTIHGNKYLAERALADRLAETLDGLHWLAAEPPQALTAWKEARRE